MGRNTEGRSELKPCYFNDYVILDLGMAHFGTLWPDAARAVPLSINTGLQFSKHSSRAILLSKTFNCIKPCRLSSSSSEKLDLFFFFHLTFKIFLLYLICISPFMPTVTCPYIILEGQKVSLLLLTIVINMVFHDKQPKKEQKTWT